MKKLYATIGLFLATLLSAQIPQAFSYQTIAFNSAGAPIANGNVALKISILENSATGTVLYTETHTKTTNSKGLVNLNIGQGTPTTGSFGAINWGTNTKFVKVEMDPAGGSNYTNVGVNQLMSVPYSQVSKTVVTGAGQGITLTSPNGTAYTLGVNNAGTLSLPTNSNTVSQIIPTNLYMYGSYNSYNASNAELLRLANGDKIGYKYFAANSTFKFTGAQNSGAQNYGSSTGNDLIPNGNEYLINSNGFYQIRVAAQGNVNGVTFYGVYFNNFNPTITFDSGTATVSGLTYGVSTNVFNINVSGVTNTNAKAFKISLNNNSFSETLGDNLNDGSLDLNGDYINFPNTTSTPKNYKITFTIQFNGTGTYTITQI